jgi:predicted RNA binding protein YcfA (HicA-like mRNA interferase family)
MGRLSGCRYRDVTKRLKYFGFALDRQVAGSHRIWYQPSGNRYTRILNYPCWMLTVEKNYLFGLSIQLCV